MARSADEHSQGSAAEREAILTVVLDYIAGWFDADPARVERALHPELCKRSIRPDGSVNTLTAPMLIESAAQGRGRGEDSPDRRVQVEVDHIDGPLAAAVVRCHQYVDYLQLIRTAGGWKILNVVWRRRHPG